MKKWINVSVLGLLAALMLAIGYKKGLLKLKKKHECL